MELADSETIRSLRDSASPAGNPVKARRSRAHRGMFPDGNVPRVGRPRHCACGRCHTCLENARWERIFAAKFADPDYYRPQPVRFGSSLQWL